MNACALCSACLRRRFLIELNRSGVLEPWAASRRVLLYGLPGAAECEWLVELPGSIAYAAFMKQKFSSRCRRLCVEAGRNRSD